MMRLIKESIIPILLLLVIAFAFGLAYSVGETILKGDSAAASQL